MSDFVTSTHRRLADGQSLNTGMESKTTPQEPLATILAAVHARLHELEAQCLRYEVTNQALLANVMETIHQMSDENTLYLAALIDIVDLKVGVLDIARDAIKRAADRRVAS